MAPTRMPSSTAASKGGPLSPPRGRTLSSPLGRTLSPPHCRPSVVRILRRPLSLSGISLKETDEGPSKETDEVTDEETGWELKKTDECPPSPPLWSIRQDGVDSAMEKANAMSESSYKEWDIQDSYDTFAKHIKTYTQYFEFEDYLWEESDFVKHDSDAESILSSGILPKDKVSLLRPNMIIECLEEFIRCKKLVFKVQQMFDCKMHMLECDFIKYDSNYEEIVDLMMEKFPHLCYSDIRCLVEIHVDWLAMLVNVKSNARKEFRLRYIEDCKKDYQDSIESIKRPEYQTGPGIYHYVFRDIVHNHRSKGLEVDVEKEFWEFMNISPRHRTPLHGRPS